MKGKVVAITNHKGGVGKTTTAQNLAYGLAEQGKKVLLLDMDGQQTLTTVMPEVNGATIFDVIVNGKDLEPQQCDAVDFIKGDLNCYGTKAMVQGKSLTEVLEPVIDQYDYVIVDTPPTVSELTFKVLEDADYMLITAFADIPSVNGLKILLTVTLPQLKTINKKIKVAGVLLCRYSGRAVLNRQVAEFIKNVAEQNDTWLYESTIRDAVAIRESQTLKKDIYSYAGKSNVAEDYRKFVKEFIAEVEK